MCLPQMKTTSSNRHQIPMSNTVFIGNAGSRNRTHCPVGARAQCLVSGWVPHAYFSYIRLQSKFVELLVTWQMGLASACAEARKQQHRSQESKNKYGKAEKVRRIDVVCGKRFSPASRTTALVFVAPRTEVSILEATCTSAIVVLKKNSFSTSYLKKHSCLKTLYAYSWSTTTLCSAGPEISICT